MEIQVSETGWVLADIEPLIADLLKGLPACAAADDEAAAKRIYSSPTGGADVEADEEWQETVEPEMRELFQSHIDVVTGDLAAMSETKEGFTLEIPMQNARAWIHTLNQARLALGARHEIKDEDSLARRKGRTSEKAFALMQIDFYGMLLSLLVGQTEF